MLDITYSMLGNIPSAAIAAILAGFLRNISGWIENTYKDGKVEPYEIKQLYGTITKYFAAILLLMLGFPIEQAVTGSFILDIGSSTIKNTRNAD